MPYAINACPLCGHATNGVETPERMITLQCRGCSGIVTIEFDPPDDRTLRGRIIVIRPPFGRREIVPVDDDPEFLQTLGRLAAARRLLSRGRGHGVQRVSVPPTSCARQPHHGRARRRREQRRRPKMPVVIVTGFASGREKKRIVGVCRCSSSRSSVTFHEPSDCRRQIAR
jgi:hypothetical protein